MVRTDFLEEKAQTENTVFQEGLRLYVKGESSRPHSPTHSLGVDL